MDLKIIRSALLGFADTGDIKFSKEDLSKAAIKAIYEEVGLSENASTRDFIAHRDEIFALLAEAIDEVLPKTLTDIMGEYADVKTYARDEAPIYKMTTGRRRARLSLKRGARSGIYRAAQWDGALFELPTTPATFGVYVTLEDLLLGRYSLQELYNNVLEAVQEMVYGETVKALRTAKTLAPASHIISDGGENLEANLDKLIRIAKAYGDGTTIFGFSTELSKLQNLKDWAVKADRDDIRAYGTIKLYHGVPVVELPNYLIADGATASWAFKENDIFVLPADTKPVKVALRGDMVIQQDTEPAGGEKWNCSKLFGVGLVLADNVCILTDTSGESTGAY